MNKPDQGDQELRQIGEETDGPNVRTPLLSWIANSCRCVLRLRGIRPELDERKFPFFFFFNSQMLKNEVADFEITRT